MKEFLHKKTAVAATVLSAVALAGCSMEKDTYQTNPWGVECDGNRTSIDLIGDGTGTFFVHGKKQEDVAAVEVQRKGNVVSEKIDNDLTDSEPAVAEGVSPPTTVGPGPELYAIAANVGWIINVNQDSVVIQGACDNR